jgi:predicted ATPase
MPEQELANALAQLTEAEVIIQHGSGYMFKRALVRDAAHESLLKRRRQELHARISGALEEWHPDIVAARPELLAYHLTGAGLPERAIPSHPDMPAAQHHGQHAGEGSHGALRGGVDD